jgi:hypothetical protein
MIPQQTSIAIAIKKPIEMRERRAQSTKRMTIDEVAARSSRRD